jgi:hypothetical protein
MMDELECGFDSRASSHEESPSPTDPMELRRERILELLRLAETVETARAARKQLNESVAGAAGFEP